MLGLNNQVDISIFSPFLLENTINTLEKEKNRSFIVLGLALVRSNLLKINLLNNEW